ncbi:MAG: SMC-Scp complex subunit ScpB, partial [Bradymonadaceae bacterium]
VDSSGVLRTLQDWQLVDVVGRLDDLGRPHVYGTTDRFLEIFGLDDLTDLPTLSEDEHQSLQELYEDELDQFDEEFE